MTTKTFRIRRLFNDPFCCGILLGDVSFYAKKLGFNVLGYVIMPDHFHMILWRDVEEKPKLTVSQIMHDIKGRSAKRISNYLLSGRRGFYAPSRKRQGMKALPTQDILYKRDAIKIWQPSFYDFNIYSDEKLGEKLNYIHWNPVRAGLCENPEDLAVLFICPAYSGHRGHKRDKMNLKLWKYTFSTTSRNSAYTHI